MQPARTEGLRAAADVQRLPHRQPDGMGRVRGRGRTHPPRHVGAVQRLHGGQRGAAAPDLEFIHESERLNPTSTPRQPTTVGRTRPPPPGIGWSRPSGGPRRGGRPEELAGEGALVYLSLGSLGSADVELMHGSSRCSRTPRTGTSSRKVRARRVRAAGQHVGTGPRAPDQRDPALRSGDHPRRQQHDGLRRSSFDDDRPAAVLGPVRQRPAGPRARPGRPLDTYAFEDEDLRRAVDRLVADDNLRARMDAVGKAVRAEDGLGRAADLIESIARGAPT